MNTPNKFKCAECGTDIVVSFLKPGEEAMCRNCDHRQIVPEQLEEAAPEEYDLPVRAKRPSESEAGNRRQQPPLVQVFTGFLWVVILYVFHFDVHSNGHILTTTTIADAIALVSIIKLHKLNLVRYWPGVGIALCCIQLLGKAAGFVGLAEYVSMHFEFFIVAACLVSIYKLSERLDFLREVRTLAIWALVATLGLILMIVGAAVSVGAIIAIHNFIAEYTPLGLVAQIMGMLAPIMLLYLISVGLSIYTIVDARSLVRKQPKEALEPAIAASTSIQP